MDFGLTPEQAALQERVDAFCRQHARSLKRSLS